MNRAWSDSSLPRSQVNKLVTKISFAHKGLLASKLGKKASTNLGLFNPTWELEPPTVPARFNPSLGRLISSSLHVGNIVHPQSTMRFALAPIILIFGTSHVGKSTLASSLAEHLGWQVLSTDKMGRHPGRPWPEVRVPVAEFYRSLSDETIYWFQRVHQENMWPHVRQQIADASGRQEGRIFEGSALRPEFLATLDEPDLVPLGLYADDEFLRARILLSSGYRQQDEANRLLIDKFITRSLRQNADYLAVANDHGFQVINVANERDLAYHAERFIALLKRNYSTLNSGN